MFPYDNNYCSFKNMGDEKSIFTTSDNQVTSTTANDNSTSLDNGGSKGQGSRFSPLAPPFQSRINVEPLVGDTAPSNLGLDFMNLRIGDSDSLYDDKAEQNDHNYFMGSRTESVASSAPTSGNIWTENNHSNNNKNGTIDFFLKTFALANTYASMLTREQTSVLKDIRPELIYEFLQEIIRVRSQNKMHRALPNECAFCKNNGESEEKYAEHALKDWKGRVQCPVLRAFRCPRCGATGDRAHTIKYCPANEHGMDRQGPFQRRRNSSWFGETSQANYGAGTPSFSAQSNPTQFNAAQFNAAQSNPTQFNPAQSNPAQSNPAQSPDSTFNYASFFSNIGNLN